MSVLLSRNLNIVVKSSLMVFQKKTIYFLFSMNDVFKTKSV